MHCVRWPKMGYSIIVVVIVVIVAIVVAVVTVVVVVVKVSSVLGGGGPSTGGGRHKAHTFVVSAVTTTPLALHTGRPQHPPLAIQQGAVFLCKGQRRLCTNCTSWNTRPRA